MFTNKNLFSNACKLVLCAVLIFTIQSCGTKTVFFWNWKDVIGLSIIVLIFSIIAILFIIQWIDDKIKLWKRNRYKK